jgi:hypothetical protein
MDDKSIDLLQQILSQQKQQTDLLRRNLRRIRFSLFSLMLLITLCAIALEIGIYVTRPKTLLIKPSTAPLRTFPTSVNFPNNMPPLVDGNRKIPDRTAE